MWWSFTLRYRSTSEFDFHRTKMSWLTLAYNQQESRMSSQNTRQLNNLHFCSGSSNKGKELQGTFKKNNLDVNLRTYGKTVLASDSWSTKSNKTHIHRLKKYLCLPMPIPTIARPMQKDDSLVGCPKNASDRRRLRSWVTKIPRPQVSWSTGCGFLLFVRSKGTVGTGILWGIRISKRVLF